MRSALDGLGAQGAQLLAHAEHLELNDRAQLFGCVRKRLGLRGKRVECRQRLILFFLDCILIFPTERDLQSAFAHR